MGPHRDAHLALAMCTPMALDRTHVTVILGIAQTLGWASSYYLLAILAQPISHSIDTSTSAVFGAFSLALLVSAATGPIAGRCIDRMGGRKVLMFSSLLFAIGLLLMSQAHSIAMLMLGWAIMGMAMGSGLYEAAFATVVHLYGKEARRPITGITLFAGFASTVGWPLSSTLEQLYDWRTVCMVWAAMHMLLGLPLYAWLARVQTAAATSTAALADTDTNATPPPLPKTTVQPHLRITAMLMALVFAVSWFNSTAMAAHLPHILHISGAALGVAIAAAALVGPAQVAGRVAEFTLLKNSHPLLSARMAILVHPLAALCLWLIGTPAAAVFAILHGLGNGILTIAVGTLPLKVFGTQGYGQRQGWLMVPARIAQAGAPFLFGVAIDAWGKGALWLSSGLACMAFAALWRMRIRAED